MLDVGDEQLLSRRHHSLYWFYSGACIFELVDEIVSLHLLLGVCVNEILDKIFARRSSHR